MYVIIFPCFSYFWNDFVETCSFSAFNFSQNYIKLFHCKLSKFDVLLAINDFLIDLSETLAECPSRLLKYSFHFWNFSSWLTAFSFTLEVLFLQLTSFTVCHTIRDCLSSTKFLILLIWNWKYSFCSFWYVFVLSELSKVSKDWHLLGFFY